MCYIQTKSNIFMDLELKIRGWHRLYVCDSSMSNVDSMVGGGDFGRQVVSENSG